MIHWSQFFTLEHILMMIPVILAGMYLMPLLYKGLVNAVIPWKDVNSQTETRWTGQDRRKKLERRNSDRMAKAREEWRRGNTEVAPILGRRKSDLEAVEE